MQQALLLLPLPLLLLLLLLLPLVQERLFCATCRLLALFLQLLVAAVAVAAPVGMRADRELMDGGFPGADGRPPRCSNAFVLDL
jgi:hypothetical protein